MRLTALLFVTASLIATPVLAQNAPLFATTTATTPSKTRTNSVAKSNADSITETLKAQGMSEMPMDAFPKPELLDADNDGIADSEDKDIAIPNPFAPQETAKKDEPKKKQVYLGTPDVELRRTIADPRIDDGYVQGLIQQRAPR